MSPLPSPTPRPWCILGGRLYGADDGDGHSPIAESITKRVALNDHRYLQWCADLAYIVEAVNAYNPERGSAKDQAEWDRQDAYRKGFEAGGRVERERADWLEAERERLQADLAALSSPKPEGEGAPCAGLSGTVWGIYLIDGRFMDIASSDKQTAIDMAEAHYEPDQYTVRALDPSPPLPEADGEVVAWMRTEGGKPYACVLFPPFETWETTGEFGVEPLVRQSALVSALRERDEARTLAQTFVTIAHTKEVAAFASEAAREKAEQVAAGLREGLRSAIKQIEALCSPLDVPDEARAALRASTEEGKTATPSVKDEEAQS